MMKMIFHWQFYKKHHVNFNISLYSIVEEVGRAFHLKMKEETIGAVIISGGAAGTLADILLHG
jgi:hypothetical protein